MTIDIKDTILGNLLMLMKNNAKWYLQYEFGYNGAQTFEVNSRISRGLSISSSLEIMIWLGRQFFLSFNCTSNKWKRLTNAQ